MHAVPRRENGRSPTRRVAIVVAVVAVQTDTTQEVHVTVQR